MLVDMCLPRERLGILGSILATLADLYIDMCLDMRMDICADMCPDMCVNMCVDMCGGRYVDGGTLISWSFAHACG